MSDTRIQTYKGYTLIDITNTHVTRYSVSHEHTRNQQRNYETLIQILGLRTQLLRIYQTNLFADLCDYKFGSSYIGKHNIWVFEFDVEYQDIYTVDHIPFKILLDDFCKVPIIAGLAETVTLNMPLFYTSNNYKNLYFT